MNKLVSKFLRQSLQQKSLFNFGVNNTSSTIVMIKPVDFCFNQQTALDNEFMDGSVDATTANKNALKEFENAVKLVRNSGVNVIEFDKSQYHEMKNNLVPDAVFPNNWFSTDIDGSIYLYPMLAENRTAEKNQFRYIAEHLSQQFKINQIKNLEFQNQVLEGTGSLLLDRVHKRVYCNLSKRAEEGILREWAAQKGYEPVVFKCFSRENIPYYHTNVVLSIGEHFAVFCAESVTDVQVREEVVRKLQQDREVILITREQVEQFFCGNILEVESDADRSKHIFMSHKAYTGFTQEQIKQLEKYGNVVHPELDTIEQVGGGSMRCMMAEVFLPKKN